MKFLRTVVGLTRKETSNKCFSGRIRHTPLQNHQAELVSVRLGGPSRSEKPSNTAYGCTPITRTHCKSSDLESLRLPCPGAPSVPGRAPRFGISCSNVPPTQNDNVQERVTSPPTGDAGFAATKFPQQQPTTADTGRVVSIGFKHIGPKHLLFSNHRLQVDTL